MIDARRFNCFVMGDALSGKTAITQMFLSDGSKFTKSYNVTCGIEVSSKAFSIPGEDAEHKVQFIVFDTSGHELYTDVIRTCAKSCDILLLVYDVTSEKSFENLKEWIKLATEATGNKAGTPIFIFGNKTDLHNRRAVFIQNEKAEEIMKDFGVIRSLEGSAKSFDGVHEIFTSMAQYLLENSTQ